VLPINLAPHYRIVPARAIVRLWKSLLKSLPRLEQSRHSHIHRWEEWGFGYGKWLDVCSNHANVCGYIWRSCCYILWFSGVFPSFELEIFGFRMPWFSIWVASFGIFVLGSSIHQILLLEKFRAIGFSHIRCYQPDKHAFVAVVDVECEKSGVAYWLRPKLTPYFITPCGKSWNFLGLWKTPDCKVALSTISTSQRCDDVTESGFMKLPWVTHTSVSNAMQARFTWSDALYNPGFADDFWEISVSQRSHRGSCSGLKKIFLCFHISGSFGLESKLTLICFF